LSFKKSGLILALVLCGCITTPTSGIGGFSYEQTVSKWTQGDSAYDNLHASFRIKVTLLSRELVEKQLDLDKNLYKWTPEQFESEKQKALYDLQSQTTVLVSLYTQKDEDNTLDKSHTPWNMFLEINGKRYTANQVKRIYENRVVLINKYPYLDPWSRNYFVKFPLPTDDTSAGASSFNLTGPLGAVELKF
jgi:hypothetical protein